MRDFAVEKNESKELPIPTVWRAVLKKVADACIKGDHPTTHASVKVDLFAPDIVEINSRNIAEYPEALGPLSAESWKTSMYIWMGNHWDVLIDLSTATGETSDLVLHAKIHENGDQFVIELGLIYVP